jgi:hypothetical protein
MKSSDPKLWTTRDLCQRLVLPGPLGDEAIVEFLRRYRGILKNLSASLPRRSWNEDYETFEQWVMSWFYAERKIVYLADLVLNLDASLPDNIVAGKVGAYFRKTVIKTTREDYLEEEGFDGKMRTVEFIEEIEQRGPRTRLSSPSEEDGNPSEMELEGLFDDPNREHHVESEEPYDLKNDAESKDEHNPGQTESPGMVSFDNILGENNIDFSYGSSSDSLEGEDLFSRFFMFYRALSPRDRVIFALKEYCVFERLIFLDEDWEYLEELTGSTRPVIEKSIEKEYRARPGATKKPIRTEFIASLLSLSQANVDQIFSRLRKKRAELLGNETEER